MLYKTYIADWKDSTKYPALVGTPRTQWAWEFLRRTSEYVLHVNRARQCSRRFLAAHDTVDTARQLPPNTRHLQKNCPEDASLIRWKCHPVARPSYMTLKEYRAKHGRDPSTSVSYKQFAFLRWGISQLVTPDTSFDPAVFKIEHTRLHPEVIDLRAETLLVPRSYAAGTLLPFEIHAVIDVRDHVAQLERLKARIDHARKSAPLAAALTKQKRTTKHTLKAREMWVMLRLVDALRADAARAGWKPKSPLEQFLVPRFQLKNFLDTIKNEAHHARNRATTDVDWLTSTLDLAQLKNWRQDHLLKLLHHRGHTELI